jgi:hypothetical protein
MNNLGKDSLRNSEKGAEKSEKKMIRNLRLNLQILLFQQTTSAGSRVQESMFNTKKREEIVYYQRQSQ